MMRHFGMDLKVTVNRASILTKIIENRERHITIFKEARAGYIKNAKEALLARLEELENGKAKSLSFSIIPPMSMVSTYDTVIGMLQASVDENIVLTATEYRQLAEDEWDWMDSFLSTNSRYSASATAYAASKMDVNSSIEED